MGCFSKHQSHLSMLADDFLDGYLNAGDDQAAVSIVASQKPLWPLWLFLPKNSENHKFWARLFEFTLQWTGRTGLLLGCPDMPRTLSGIGSFMIFWSMESMVNRSANPLVQFIFFQDFLNFQFHFRVDPQVPHIFRGVWRPATWFDVRQVLQNSPSSGSDAEASSSRLCGKDDHQQRGRWRSFKSCYEILWDGGFHKWWYPKMDGS